MMVCVYKRVRYCVQLENTMLVLTEKCSDVDKLTILVSYTATL